MTKIILFLLVITIFTGCGVNDVHTLRSPCVANESDDVYNSPCIRRPANANWLV